MKINKDSEKAKSKNGFHVVLTNNDTGEVLFDENVSCILGATALHGQKGTFKTIVATACSSATIGRTAIGVGCLLEAISDALDEDDEDEDDEQ